MHKRTRTRPRSQKNAPRPDGPSLIVVVSVTTLTILGNMVGEVVSAPQPHPFHWSIASAGALIGWAIGRIYFNIEGDII